MKIDKFLEQVKIAEASLSGTFPKESISKVHLKPNVRNRLNKAIGKLLAPYFDKIPLQPLLDILEKDGLVAVQEDATEWEGFLMGRNQQIYFHLGWKDTMDSEKRFMIVPNAMLALSWYKFETGRYEITSYVT